LNLAKDSPEYKLFSDLTSDEPVDADKTKGWISLDKVKFETGKSNLAPGSDGQLKSIVQAMQFSPNSHIKIGGYTDNTGTDEANMRVSTARAKTTAEKIISMGVEANRVTYEGYGSQHPVCPPNDTEECRTANRRVDVKVTKK